MKDTTIHLLKQFCKIRTAEFLSIWILLSISGIVFDRVWLHRPNNILVLFTSPLFVIVLFYTYWGYLLTSALSFLISGLFSSSSRMWLAVTSGVTFAGHASVLVTLFEMEMTSDSWFIKIFVTIMSAAATFLLSSASRAGGAGDYGTD